MRTEPDVTRVVRSWLEEGANRMPERVLDSVMELLPSTPQRRPMWLARRFPNMNNFARVAVIAAVVIIVVIAAVNILPRQAGFGAPGPTPTTPVPTPTVTPSPTVAGTLLGASDKDSSLAAGTYRIADPFQRPFTVTLPAAWTSKAITATDVQFRKAAPESGAAWLTVDLAENVFADPCHAGDRPIDPPVAQTVDAFTAALTSMVGFTAGPVTDVVIGGHPGKTFVLTNSIDTTTTDCTGGAMLPLFTFGGGGSAATNGGATEHLWVLDVGGTLVVIDGESFPGTPAFQLLEITEVVPTITFP